MVEEAAWLRKKYDYAHINVAELDAVSKGLNLAVKWHLDEITVMSDSATVCSWLNSIITEKKTESELLGHRRCL